MGKLEESLYYARDGQYSEKYGVNVTNSIGSADKFPYENFNPYSLPSSNFFKQEIFKEVFEYKIVIVDYSIREASNILQGNI